MNKYIVSFKDLQSEEEINSIPDILGFLLNVVVESWKLKDTCEVDWTTLEDIGPFITLVNDAGVIEALHALHCVPESRENIQQFLYWIISRFKEMYFSCGIHASIEDILRDRVSTYYVSDEIYWTLLDKPKEALEYLIHFAAEVKVGIPNTKDPDTFSQEYDASVKAVHEEFKNMFIKMCQGTAPWQDKLLSNIRRLNQKVRALEKALINLENYITYNQRYYGGMKL